MKNSLLVISAMIFLASCQTVPAPIDDYALARAAMDSARAVQAARHSPGFWHQADEAYRKAKILYRDRDYLQARQEFIRARAAAEKAENSARVIRQKSGDIL